MPLNRCSALSITFFAHDLKPHPTYLVASPIPPDLRLLKSPKHIIISTVIIYKASSSIFRVNHKHVNLPAFSIFSDNSMELFKTNQLWNFYIIHYRHYSYTISNNQRRRIIFQRRVWPLDTFRPNPQDGHTKKLQTTHKDEVYLRHPLKETTPEGLPIFLKLKRSIYGL